MKISFGEALIEAWQAFDNGSKYLSDTRRRMLQLINAWASATKQNSTGNNSEIPQPSATYVYI